MARICPARDFCARNAAARSMPTAISSPRALDHRLEMRRAIVALNELLRVVGRETALALQVFAEAARADGEVAREQRNAVVENVDVRDVVADVEQADDAVHRVGMIDLERVVERERFDVDDRPARGPASVSMRIFDSISSRLAATSSTLISRPSPSGSRIWKSSSTDSMSNGTCCSASQRISSRACCFLDALDLRFS